MNRTFVQFRLTRIALRNLSRNRRRTFLSATAIGIGVAGMLVLYGMLNGQRFMMLANLTEGQLGALQVHKRGYTANIHSQPLTLDMADSEALRAKLGAVEGVRVVAPRLRFGGMLSTADSETTLGQSTFVMVTAVDPELETAALPRRYGLMREGVPLPPGAGPEIQINEELRRPISAELWTDPSQRPADLSRWPALLAPDRDGVLNGENVVVVGTFAALLPADRRNVLMPLQTAQRLLRMEGRVTEYAIAVRSLDDVEAVKQRLQAMLGPEYEVHTWKELMPLFETLVAAGDVLFGLIGAVFLFLVLLAIVNSMLMNVLERVREIGTMMAVGMRRRKILGLMLLEGAALGLLGGLLGIVLGSLVTAYLHRTGIHVTVPGAAFKHALRPFLTAPELVRAAVWSTVGTSLAALWPAYHASRLDPVVALRAT